MSGHTPWEDVKAKVTRPHEFSGVFYASNQDLDELIHRIADIVCPTGGCVVTKPPRDEEIEIEGNDHDDD